MGIRLLYGVVTALAVSLGIALTAAPGRAEQPVSPQLMGMYGGYQDQQDPQAMQRVREVGVQVMRVYVEWNQLQPTEAYNTSDLLEASARAMLEQQLRSVTAAGLAPVVLIGEAPEWAAPRARGPLAEGKLGSFVRFVELLVRTYKDSPYSVRYWELWPEPDALGTIPAQVRARYGDDILKRTAWGDRGAQYAAMLKAVYPAIKRIDPSAKVLNGAIAYDWFGGNSPGFNAGGIFNYRFIDDVVAAGGACCFDILAFNSYAAFAPGWEERAPGRDIAAKTNYLRQRLQAMGVNKPMMVLEVGFWSRGSRIPMRQSDGQIVLVEPTPERHAAYVAKVYIRAATVGLQAVVWYTLRDWAYDDDKRGIINEALAPKPAYYAYRQVAEQLRGATYLGPLATSRVDRGVGDIEGHEFVRADGRRLAIVWLDGTLSGEATVRFAFQASGIAVAYDQTGSVYQPLAESGGTATLRVSTTPVYVGDVPVRERIHLPVIAKVR